MRGTKSDSCILYDIIDTYLAFVLLLLYNDRRRGDFKFPDVVALSAGERSEPNKPHGRPTLSLGNGVGFAFIERCSVSGRNPRIILPVSQVFRYPRY